MHQDTATFGCRDRGHIDDAFCLESIEDLSSAWEANAEIALYLTDRGEIPRHNDGFDILIFGLAVIG